MISRFEIIKDLLNEFKSARRIDVPIKEFRLALAEKIGTVDFISLNRNIKSIVGLGLIEVDGSGIVHIK